MDKLQCRVGFLLMLFGCGGMDSSNIIFPIVLLVVGMTLLYLNKEK